MIFGIYYIIIGSISLFSGYSYFNKEMCHENDNDNDNINNETNNIQDIIDEDVEDIKPVNNNKILPVKKMKYSNKNTIRPSGYFR